MDLFPASKEIRLLVEELRQLVRHADALLVDGRSIAAGLVKAAGVALTEAGNKLEQS